MYKKIEPISYKGSDFVKDLISFYVLLLPIGTGLAGIIGSISLMNYIAALIVLFGIFVFISLRKIELSREMIPTLLYFLYTIISVIWSNNPRFNWYVATNLINGLLFLIINGIKWNDKDIRKLKNCIVISQFIVFFVVIRNLSTLFKYRLSITVVSTIGISDFACGLCLMIAVWMQIATDSKRFIYRILSYIFIALDFGIIMMAGSRGALIMFVSMLIAWILIGNYSKKVKILSIIVIICVYVAFDLYFIKFLPATITSRMTLTAVMNSKGSGRFNLWTLAWGDFIHSNIGRMLFGYGFDSFSETIAYGSHGGHMDLMAHNFFFQTMIEGGIIGLLFLARMIYSQLRMALKNNDGMMKLALIGLFVAGLSIDMQVTRIWGFILAFNLIRNGGYKCNQIETIE